MVQHHFGYITKLTQKTWVRCHWRALKSSNLRSTRGIAVFLSSSCVVGDERWNSRLSRSLSRRRGRHLSSTTVRLSLYLVVMCRGDDRWNSRLSRSLSLSLTVVMCRRRRDRESVSVALSLSLVDGRHVSSATRQGIRVCRALSLSLVD